MEKDLTTEAKIKEAATRVFIAKGFNGCSSREIAKEAGMNVALVNYHFQSKSHLFEVVVATVMEEFVFSMIDVFKSDLPLISKTRIFIEKEYDFLSKHPDIPGFIINELGKKDKTFFERINFIDQIRETKIYDEVHAAQEKGEVRKMDMTSIMLLMMGNCHFPFMAKPMIQTIQCIDDKTYQNQLTLHKQYVTEMLVNYLFPTNK
ncbi:MAG: TetR family transcriptional regulator [Fluviicola sp.]|jgi:TetR/AcrR family transcriptional regulator|nr:TetR family transcriptional regulator [Fluviicola sp.]